MPERVDVARKGDDWKRPFFRQIKTVESSLSAFLQSASLVFSISGIFQTKMGLFCMKLHSISFYNLGINLCNKMKVRKLQNVNFGGI